jgi:aryl-alcohol dehydrogenase-like predicted oxidoreductase
MQYRQLGDTDIRVSSVALGCWSLIGDANWGEQSRSDSCAAIDAALEAGINLLDTAPVYGNGESETLLGEILQGRRDRLVIADKVLGRLDRAHVFAACEQSLRRLQTDRIDLYQVHWPDRETPFAETVAALDTLVRQGKIRCYGVSNFGPADLAAILAAGAQPVTNQMPYSLLWRGIETEVLPCCREKNIGLLSYSSLMQGLLTGKFLNADAVPAGRARTRHFGPERPQTRHHEAGAEEATFAAIDAVRSACRARQLDMAQVALAWVAAQPGVASVLAGARNAAQARTNAAAGALTLDDDMLAVLDRSTARLKSILGANLDPWQSDSRIR